MLLLELEFKLFTRVPSRTIVAIRRGLPFESESRWSEPCKDRLGERPSPLRNSQRPQTHWILHWGCTFPVSRGAASRSSA